MNENNERALGYNHTGEDERGPRYKVCSVPTSMGNAYQTDWWILAVIVFYWRGITRLYYQTRLIDTVTGKQRVF